jgi:hypothetical protein
MLKNIYTLQFLFNFASNRSSINYHEMTLCICASLLINSEHHFATVALFNLCDKHSVMLFPVHICMYDTYVKMAMQEKLEDSGVYLKMLKFQI